MKRNIVGFDQDDAGDWRAWLDCHHAQHMRHNPPFTNRPWVKTEVGRAEKLGFELECVRCDRFELPASLKAYKQTPVFTEATIPKGLLRDHSTKLGVWGLIQVVEGELLYESATHSTIVTSDQSGVVVPTMKHRVAPLGKVRFFVEFLRGHNSD